MCSSPILIVIMPLDNNGISFDPSYKYEFCTYLKNQKRLFKKQVAEISEDSVIEDFKLLDTYPSTYIEVWGMNDHDYLY